MTVARRLAIDQLRREARYRDKLVLLEWVEQEPDDCLRLMFTLLGGGLRDPGWTGEHLIPSQLAILPGATHYDIDSRTSLLLPVLAPFLDPKQA